MSAHQFKQEFMRAAQCGDIERVQKMLLEIPQKEKGSNVTQEKVVNSALLGAVLGNQVEVVKHLVPLATNKKECADALVHASSLVDTRCLQVLVGVRFRKTAMFDAMYRAFTHRNLPAVRILAQRMQHWDLSEIFLSALNDRLYDCADIVFEHSTTAGIETILNNPYAVYEHAQTIAQEKLAIRRLHAALTHATTNPTRAPTLRKM